MTVSLNTDDTKAARHAGIDVVRIVMTILVILHHTAIVYGGSGGWFWRERLNGSNPPLVIFNAVNQSYFMGLFFLLAGYYTPASFDRKGPRRYLADRLLRLGVPLAAFFLVLYPLTEALAGTADGAALLPAWIRGMVHGPRGPGPLWFAIALLIFAAAYAAWREVWPRPAASATALPPARVMLAAIVTVGLGAFAVRLAMPVGRETFWLQLGYFPSYVLLFTAGVAAAPHRLLERITTRDALPWMAITAAALATLPVVLTTRAAAGGFEGGMNLNALYYALWEPFVATGVILGLFAWANRARRPAGAVTTWIAAGAFGAFILHPPVVVALSVRAAAWTAAPSIKFLVVGTAACAASFALGGALRSLPGLRRIL